MSPKIMIATLLIAIGIVAFAYQGITYTTRGKSVDLGPIQVSKQKTNYISLPPIAGAMALLGGVALLIADRKRFSRAAAVIVLVAGASACVPQPAVSQENQPAEAPRVAEARAPAVIRVTVPQGTEVHVTLSTAVGSETSQIGDTLTATTTSPVFVGERLAIPMGSTIRGRVADVVPGTKGLKVSEKGGAVALSFDRVTTPQGFSTPMSASLSSIASSKGKTAGIIGGSAAGGALLGKILGGSTKDAAVGAVLGGGIGTGIAAGTKGKELVIPAGTHLAVVLDRPLTIADRS